MDEIIQEVLKELGWECGFSLPLANDENRLLQKKLSSIIVQKQNRSIRYDTIIEKIKKLTRQRKSVFRVHDQNEGILCMYKTQVDAENKKIRLGLAEEDHIKSHIRNIESRTEVVSGWVKFFHNKLTEKVERLENLKGELSWDVEVMEASELIKKKSYEVDTYFRKLTEKDRQRMCTLVARVHILYAEVRHARTGTKKMSNDCLEFELNSSKAQQILRQLQEDRGKLLKELTRAMNNLNYINRNARRSLQNSEKIKEGIRKGKIKLNEEVAFMKRGEDTNKELEMEIQDINIYSSQVRRKLIFVTDNVNSWSGDAKTKKCVFEAGSSYVAKQQRICKTIKGLVWHREIEIAAIRKDIAQFHRTLEQIKSRTLTVDERSKRIDKRLSFASRLNKRLEKNFYHLERCFDKYQVVRLKCQDRLNSKRSEITATEGSIETIRKQIKRQLKVFNFENAILSDISMKLCIREAKLVNVETQTRVPRKKQKVLRTMKQLEKRLVTYVDRFIFLEIQNKDVKKEVEEHLLGYAYDMENSTKIRSDHKTATALHRSGMKELAAAKLIGQRKQVEEMILSFKCKRLAKSIKIYGKKIYDRKQLGNRLVSLTRKRKLDVLIARDLNNLKKKSLEEERLRLKNEILCKSKKVEALKTKFNFATFSLGKDEKGKVMSFSTYKLNFAQESLRIQIEFKETFAKLKVTTEETIAMENTINVINLHNFDVKHCLYPVNKDGKEENKMEELKKTLKDESSMLRENRRSLLPDLDYCKEMKKKMSYYRAKIIELQESIICDKKTLVEIDEDAEYRKEKLCLVDKQIMKTQKNIPANKNLEKYDKIIQARQIQDTNRETVQHLAKLSLESDEVSTAIKLHFDDNGLQLPKVRTSLPISESVSARTITTIPDDVSNKSSSTSSPSACTLATVLMTLPDEKAEKKTI